VYIYRRANTSFLTFGRHLVADTQGGDVLYDDYLLSVMASWWPFIMLIGAWIVVARFTRQRTASGATMIELQEQHVEETRRTNVLA
jgi:hypothetical protein